MKKSTANQSDTGRATTPKRVNYRKLAIGHYPALCAHCGFGIRDVLEVAHIDGVRSNNALSNLVILCPNCHKMHDLDIISTRTIIEMRDRPKDVRWAKRMKDAGRKAADTRKRRLAGRKAAATRARKRTLLSFLRESKTCPRFQRARPRNEIVLSLQNSNPYKELHNSAVILRT